MKPAAHPSMLQPLQRSMEAHRPMWRTLAAAGPQQFSSRPATKRRKAGDNKNSRKQPTRAPGSGPRQRRQSSEARDTDLRKHPELYSLVSDQDNAAEAAPPTPASRPPAASPAIVKLPAHKPEVLAPAGGWPQLRAAVENGADAVYFGLTVFNARARAANFEAEELPEVMGYLHDRGAKGYLVLNVLVFDEELGRVQEVLRGVAAAAVDAVIVQDAGLVELCRRLAPGLPVHGSTQMSITSAEGAQFAAGRGVERVVVGRELSVRDISRVSAGGGAEVEAFVQGALCVSYSGQCFSSEAWGGRSANRGQCAQACRLPYGLVVGGALTELGDMRYLLSPQDLAAVELVPELVQAGVTSFKIEGRLKGPEYVAATVVVYRRAVDAAWAALTQHQQQQQQQGSGGGGGGAASASEAAERGRLALTEAEWRDLRQVFARGQDGEHGGLTPGFLEGSAHQRLVRGRSPRHRGTFLGTVQQVTRSGAVLQLRQPVRRGCGVVFDAGDPQREEQGGSVFGVVEAGGRSVEAAAAGATVELQFGRGQVDLNSVAPGQLVWQTKDPALEARLRASYDALPAAAQRRLPVAVAVAAGPGRPMRVTLRDEQGCIGSGESDAAAEAAAARPLSEADVRRAVGQHLGGDSPLAAASWDLSGCQLEPGLFLPAAAIKEARRRAVAALMAERRRRAAATVAGLQEGDVLAEMLEEIRQRGEEDRRAEQGSSSGGGPVLRVLCRSKAQVDAALALPWLREVVLDFLEVHGLKEACEAVQAAGKRLVVATPRILKPGEQRLCLFYLRLGADALLLRSAGLLHQLMEAGGPGAAVPGCEAHVPQLEGDFSLNATNALSADLLLNSGLSRLAPTHDCNAAQLQQLARTLGGRGRRLEAVLHQHLPIFHTEHCVFCRFLSDGNDYRDCGHPCESNTVHLRDDKGRDHLVLADMGCRNTVFDASAQSGLPHLAGLVAAGFGALRVELVDEPADYVAPLLEGYRAALQAVVDGGGGGGGNGQHAQFWRWMQELPDANGRAHGVGLGSLEVRAERSSGSMKPTAASLR